MLILFIGGRGEGGVGRGGKREEDSDIIKIIKKTCSKSTKTFLFHYHSKK